MAPLETPTYDLRESGEYLIAGYNSATPFASFLPGIAGAHGIPMWLFYVNRGQCVCSMGVRDKQHPIMEYLPANRAYQLASTQGFRTYVKLPKPAPVEFYEPFQHHVADRGMTRTQSMIISPAGLRLEEVNHSLGLSFSVDYFTVPGEGFAGLARTLLVRNLNARAVSLEILDGLPLIIPYGVDDVSLKHMRRTIEAFVIVDNLAAGAPFFRGKVEPADRPDVMPITRGNFYVGFETDGDGTRLLPPIVDPQRIFGMCRDFSHPERFLAGSSGEMHTHQILENRLPCAMGLCRPDIPGKGSYTYTSIIGHITSVEVLNAILPRITARGYVEEKARANRSLVDELTQHNFVCSGEPALDHYARQNFLDNTLRGGLPCTLHGRRGHSTLHLFSRKHGDLERDYNDFQLAPTRYSQGNGNYRDVNQNRRSDLFFNPDVRDDNVLHFFNLIQLDGYNPLIVKEIRFTVRERDSLDALLAEQLTEVQALRARRCIELPFTPGELLARFDEEQILPAGGTDLFLGDLLGVCERIHEAEHGEGFWTDHWSYNLDLLENYLAVYPEQRDAILFRRQMFTYYDNPHRVQARDDKYVVWEGRAMQLNAVVLDAEKEALIGLRREDANLARTGHGTGQVYRTTLIGKLLCLIVNKMASLDAEGIGVEMEAGKPNWYDALNGLPGLMGSSINESLETKRHIEFLLEATDSPGYDDEFVQIFEELHEFVESLSHLLAQPLSTFAFWDRASLAREHYRRRTRLGVGGGEIGFPLPRLRAFLRACLEKLEHGIGRAWDTDGIIRSYFINEVIDYQKIELPGPTGGTDIKCSERGLPTFRVRAFRQHALPLFLEGPVHYLRCRPDRAAAEELVDRIERSGLYDPVLKMFKVNASLATQPMEIGRARVFSPGWFENESIWLHMEYKYLLELLRNGLHQAFYRHFWQVMVPFFPPEVYGRSILENSSFIVSSVNADSSIHGNGYIARLSGATAEFIHILMLMAVGPEPFRMVDGVLQLCLRPALDARLFTRSACTRHVCQDGVWRVVEFPARSFSFMFLGSVLVSYHNPSLADCHGPRGLRPVSWHVIDREGNSRRIDGDVLVGELAHHVRGRDVVRLEIKLGHGVSS